MHDVAIVGAGPGGSAAAHFLARSGADVVLLDKSDFPRDKTCGDGLTPRALRVLAEMGILDEVARHGQAITRYEVVAPNGKTTTARIGTTSSRHGARPAALVVPRLTLDNIILRRAVDSGARFEPGVNVTSVEPSAHAVVLRTQKGSIEARHAVIATGAATGLLTKSGFLHAPPGMMLAARAYAAGVPDSDAFRLLFGGVPQPGYGWSFPVGDGVANIGVGFLPQRTTLTAPQVFAHWSRGASLVGPLRGYPIRVDFLRSSTYAPRTLLVGEAAGLVNPLTGEGIDYALESGQIAADILARSAAESEYHATLHRRFGQVFRFSEHVRDWYCKPVLLNGLVPLANRYPELRQQLATVVLGERQPAGFGPLEMLARLLVYVVRYRPRSLNRA